eukprot:CAMPEP_0180473904 /NCGR_PEP_ID=MMETSP1036_2-20121128/30396_1 /TAXON_ID=632150 /ORGANISM="Azadinium spinosum, Strain 3D9" /LENGTH=55 /DNA_ID=CAMNT_0022481193 /DNA_START=63 /DNA_END=230 /DNA_ORIENTATION=-
MTYCVAPSAIADLTSSSMMRVRPTSMWYMPTIIMSDNRTFSLLPIHATIDEPAKK